MSQERHLQEYLHIFQESQGTWCGITSCANSMHPPALDMDFRQGVSLQKCLIVKSTLVSVHPCSTAGASSSASVVRFRKQLAVMIYHWHCGCWLLNMLVTGAEPMEV